MKQAIDELLEKKDLSREEIRWLLGTRGRDAAKLFARANRVRLETVGNAVWLRGLLELSNVCEKNCCYCGIRRDNGRVRRYSMPVEEIVTAAGEAFGNGFASLVLQSGEIRTPAFAGRIARILREIRELSRGKMHVTLSCGEQPAGTYREWLEAGAHRYLLRIESSNAELFRAIHPPDDSHLQAARLQALKDLGELGYQVGSGVMIGLPFQNTGHLADDLLFLKKSDVDMVGMGPYVEHRDSPMYRYRNRLLPAGERFFLTRKMVAVLRIMMPDINIAATTASEALDPRSPEILICSGANVVMPNITPAGYREMYALYDNKPDTHYKDLDNRFGTFAGRIAGLGYRIAWNEQGDPLHYSRKHAGEPVPSSPNPVSPSFRSR